MLKLVVPSLKGIASDIKKDGVTSSATTGCRSRPRPRCRGLWQMTQQHLGDVTQPVLVFRSTTDHVVGPASLRAAAAARCRRSQLEVRECADSYHVATLDNDAEAIFAGSLEFVRAHSRAEAGNAAGGSARR